MYRLEIMTRWSAVKGVLKQRYETLTDEDLNVRIGREGDLISRLQKKLNKSRSDIVRIIGDAV